MVLLRNIHVSMSFLLSCVHDLCVCGQPFDANDGAIGPDFLFDCVANRELLCYCAIENHCCEFCCQGCDIWDDCPSCYDRFGLNVILFSMLQLLH